MNNSILEICVFTDIYIKIGNTLEHMNNNKKMYMKFGEMICRFLHILGKHLFFYMDMLCDIFITVCFPANMTNNLMVHLFHGAEGVNISNKNF